MAGFLATKYSTYVLFPQIEVLKRITLDVRALLGYFQERGSALSINLKYSFSLKFH